MVKVTRFAVFLFTRSTEDILKKIQNLDISKTAQGLDIPCIIIKENSHIFGDLWHGNRS